MSEKPSPIFIKSDLRPAYYDDFRCLAAGCQISCCKGWSITFSKKDYLSLKRQDGSPELNDRLAHGVRRIRDLDKQNKLAYGGFTMDGGVCALLREDCLCQLQQEKGPKALPEVCQMFPRKNTVSLSGYQEYSLSPACEGVLELLWNLPDGVEFRSDPLKRELGMCFEDDHVLARSFQDIRSQCIDILQDRRFSLAERILLMGMSLKELADGETDIPAWLTRGQTMLECAQPGSLLEDSEQTLSLSLINNTGTLAAMRSTNEDFTALRTDILGQLTQIGEERATLFSGPYRRARERYQERFGNRDYFLENLMVCVFFHLQLPVTKSTEELWKSYVNFCNLYSFYHFMAVMSCRNGADGSKSDLFRSVVHASRGMLHNGQHQMRLRDEFFQNDSATLAHMAVLLSG